MRKFSIVILFIGLLLPVHNLKGQVIKNNVTSKEILDISRDSAIQLIRQKDSLLLVKKRDSINMANLIVRLEFNRDSLNSALNQVIYHQKVDSAERMRRYISYRDYNRRSRQGLYIPLGVIDDDSVRSVLKEVVDVVFEDTAYSPKPLSLRYAMERLANHLANDSVSFRIINAKQDTVPFILRKNRADSTAFFVMNSTNDSAKLYMRSLDKNTIYMWVGDDLMLKHLLKRNGAPEGIDIRWQDPNKLRIARRTVPVPAPKLWFLRSELSMTVNQNTLINWAKGGNNNIALTSDVKAWANYAKGNIRWDNSFWFVYGVQKTELLPMRKSADRINMVSNLSHKAFKAFDYTLGTGFDTQSFKGFNYPNDSVPVSKCMAPADLRVSLGLTYKPNPKLTVNISPVGGQFRFVLDTALIDQTKWGVKEGRRMNAQLVASVTVTHSAVVFKNITMNNYLNLFSNYIDHPEKVNFDWRLSLAFRINRFMSLSIQTETMYDNRTLIPLYEIQDGKKVKVGEGKRIQFNEIFGIKFMYIL